jgi:hypothetical protein
MQKMACAHDHSDEGKMTILSSKARPPSPASLQADNDLGDRYTSRVENRLQPLFAAVRQPRVFSLTENVGQMAA